MSFDNIVMGDFGQVAKVTFIDCDTNLPADISGYATTITMIFTKPDGTEVPKTALFDTDGTDGVIKYTIEESLFSVAGWWKVRGRVAASTTAKLTTINHQFYVSS